MADYFVDHGVYGATNRLGVDTPVWGVPQDGDGSVITPSAAAATATITLTAQPAVNDKLIICGITLTAVASGAAANSKNFNIGADIQATAANIAACINACTDTTINSSLSAATPQMRNIFYARAVGVNGGAVANAVEIMVRFGTATFNYNVTTNTAPQITTNATWNGSAANLPTIVQFAGGVAGCWGWVVNGSTLLGVANSIGAMLYGIGIARPYVLPQGIAALTVYDYVYARTQNDKTVDVGTNYWRRPNLFPLNLIFDTNTKWTGDTGLGTFNVTMLAPSFDSVRFYPDYSNTATSPVLFAAIRRGGFRLLYEMANSQTALAIGAGGECKMHNLEFRERYPGQSNAGNFGVVVDWGYGTLDMVSCSLSFLTPSAKLYKSVFNSGNASGACNIQDCDFAFSLTGTQSVVDQMPVIGQGYSGGVVVLAGNRFSTGSTARFRWFGSAQQSGNVMMQLHRNSGVQFNTAGAGIQRANNFQNNGQAIPSYSISSADPGFSFWHERTNGIMSWDAESGTYPYLAAVQPDGTPFSIRMLWFSQGYVRSSAPFSSGKDTKLNRLPAGIRTAAVELLVDPTKPIDPRMVEVRLSYVDTSGLPRMESSFLGGTISDSTAQWTFRNGNYTTYLPKKITLATKNQVAQGTEMSVEVVLTAPPSTSTTTTTLFFDPEWSLT